MPLAISSRTRTTCLAALSWLKQQDHVPLIFLTEVFLGTWRPYEIGGLERCKLKKSNPWECQKDYKPSWWKPPFWGLMTRASLPTCVCLGSPMGWFSMLQLCRFPSLIKLCLRAICWWLSTIKWIIDDVGKQNAALMNDELALFWHDC